MVTYHVRPRPNGQWEVKQHGADRATVVTNSRTEGVQAAKQRIQGDDKLVIHNPDGSVFRRTDGYTIGAGTRGFRL